MAEDPHAWDSYLRVLTYLLEYLLTYLFTWEPDVRK